MDKKDYYFAYFEKLTNQLEQIENPSRYALDNREFLCKYIWINVKVFRYIETDEYKSKEKVISNLELGFLLENIILLLTPEELERTFPIEKEYKGEKYQIKDYFSTKTILKKFEADKPIIESGGYAELLWDYQNKDIRKFLIAEMNRIDIARKFEGLPSISEEFAQSEGINLYHKYIDENTGKEFLVDKNGKTIPLSKPRPKNFKVIQGGKN